MVEALKTARTNILYAANNKRNKSILVTSTKEDNGKSWVANNIAVEFAQTGKNILIVDCNLRKRNNKGLIFGADGDQGLSDFLREVTNDQMYNLRIAIKYIQETKIPNLHILTNGTVPPNPAELITSNNMKTLLELLKNMYDMVILDAPSCVNFSDSIALSSMADSTILVIESKTTKAGEAKKTISQIKDVGGKIIGVILNKTHTKGKRYYGKGYGYGYYKSNEDIIDLDSKNKEIKVVTFDEITRNAKISLENEPIRQIIADKENESSEIEEEGKTDENKELNILYKINNLVKRLPQRMAKIEERLKIKEEEDKRKDIQLKDLSKQLEEIKYMTQQDLGRINEDLFEVKTSSDSANYEISEMKIKADQDYKVLQNRINLAANTNINLKEKFEDLKEKLELESKSRDDIVNDLSDKVEEIKDLTKNEIDNLMSYTQDEINSLRDNTQDEIYNLRTSNQDEINDLRNYVQDEMINLKSSNQDEINEIKDSTRNELDELVDKILGIKEERDENYARIDNELAELRKYNEDKAVEFNELKETYENDSKDKNNLIDGLSKKFNEVKDTTKEEIDDIIDKIIGLGRNKEELNDEIVELKKYNEDNDSRINAEIEDLRKYNKGTEAEIEVLRKYNEETNDRISGLERYNEDTEDRISNELQELRKSNSETEAEILAIRNENKKENKKLQSKIMVALNSNINLKGQIEKLEELQNDGLGNGNIKVEQLIEQIEDIKETTKNDMSKMIDEILGLREDKEEANMEIIELKEENKKLLEQIDEIMKKNDTIIYNLNKRMNLILNSNVNLKEEIDQKIEERNNRNISKISKIKELQSLQRISIDQEIENLKELQKVQINSINEQLQRMEEEQQSRNEELLRKIAKLNTNKQKTLPSNILSIENYKTKTTKTEVPRGINVFSIDEDISFEDLEVLANTIIDLKPKKDNNVFYS